MTPNDIPDFLKTTPPRAVLFGLSRRTWIIAAGTAIVVLAFVLIPGRSTASC